MFVTIVDSDFVVVGGTGPKWLTYIILALVFEQMSVISWE